MAREQAAVKAAKVKKQRTRFGIIGGGAVALIVALLLLTSRGGDGDNSSAAGKPKAPAVEGAAPTKASKSEVRAGAGEAIKVGDTVRIKYVAQSWGSKSTFEAGWSDSTPLKIERVGEKDSSKLWAQLVGSKPLSRVKLLAPKGDADAIGTKDPVVDVMSTEPGQPAGATTTAPTGVSTTVASTPASTTPASTIAATTTKAAG
jgi:hypothetical protein